MPEQITLMRHGYADSNMYIDGVYAAFQESDTAGRRAIREYRRMEQAALDEWELTPKGESQVCRTGRELKRVAFERPDIVLVSPHRRTQQAADILIESAGWENILRADSNELIERRWGAFDGEIQYSLNKIDMEMERILREKNPLMWEPLGGESIFSIAYGRFAYLLQRLHMSSYRNVFCVTSAELMLSARCLFENLTPEAFVSVYQERISNCQVMRYSRSVLGNPMTPEILHREK